MRDSHEGLKNRLQMSSISRALTTEGSQLRVVGCLGSSTAKNLYCVDHVLRAGSIMSKMEP